MKELSSNFEENSESISNGRVNRHSNSDDEEIFKKKTAGVHKEVSEGILKVCKEEFVKGIPERTTPEMSKGIAILLRKF